MPLLISTRTDFRSLRMEVRRAAVLGMSQETRDAWDLLVRRLSEGPATLLGAPGPHRVLLDRARRAGGLEGDLEDFSAPTRRVVIPLTGASPAQRRRWKERGHELIDLTLPVIRRASVTLGLLKAGGSRLVIAGHPGDPECAAIIGDRTGVAVIEDVDEAAMLPYAPRSAMVFQTSISSRRARVICEALRGRYRDSQVQLLDTLSPAALSRERALMKVARWADMVLIVADAADASGRALYETARCLGRPAKVIASVEELDGDDLAGFSRIALTAGEFTPDDLIDEVDAAVGG